MKNVKVHHIYQPIQNPNVFREQKRLENLKEILLIQTFKLDLPCVQFILNAHLVGALAVELRVLLIVSWHRLSFVHGSRRILVEFWEVEQVHQSAGFL